MMGLQQFKTSFYEKKDSLNSRYVIPTGGADEAHSLDAESYLRSKVKCVDKKSLFLCEIAIIIAMKKFVIIFIISVPLLALSFTSLHYESLLLRLDNAQRWNKTLTQRKEQSLDRLGVEKEDWIQYKNNEFQVSIPSDRGWDYKEKTTAFFVRVDFGTFTGLNPKIYWTIQKKQINRGTTLADYSLQNGRYAKNDTDTKIEDNFTLNGKETVMISSVSPMGQKRQYLFIEGPSNEDGAEVYMISRDYDNKMNDDFEKFYSSFILYEK